MDSFEYNLTGDYLDAFSFVSSSVQQQHAADRLMRLSLDNDNSVLGDTNNGQFHSERSAVPTGMDESSAITDTISTSQQTNTENLLVTEDSILDFSDHPLGLPGETGLDDEQHNEMLDTLEDPLIEAATEKQHDDDDNNNNNNKEAIFRETTSTTVSRLQESKREKEIEELKKNEDGIMTIGDCSCVTTEEDSSEEGTPVFNDRSWKVLSNVNDPQDLQVDDKVIIEIKTRSDKAQCVIPDRLYSSLKYEFRQTVSLDLRKSDTGVMMCKMEIVDPDQPSEELLKLNGEKLIRGVQDFTAVTINKKRTCLEVKSKFQFTGVSYHHDKKFFAMKLSYFDPSYDMSAPVFSMVSAPFQVFARRPTLRPGAVLSRTSSTSSLSSVNTVADSSGEEEHSTVPTTTKRKKNKRARKSKKPAPLPPVAIPETNSAPVQLIKKEKRQKTFAANGHMPKVPEQYGISSSTESSPAHEVVLSNFFNCLDLLVGFKQSLHSEELKLAMEVAHAKLFPEAQSNNDQRSPLPQDSHAEINQDSSVFFSS